jgi:hypothetical protein
VEREMIAIGCASWGLTMWRVRIANSQHNNHQITHNHTMNKPSFEFEDEDDVASWLVNNTIQLGVQK